MKLYDFKPNRFYLHKDNTEICVFETFETEAGLRARDIFLQTEDGFHDLTSRWAIGAVYTQEQIESMKEINPDDYPEYFI